MKMQDVCLIIPTFLRDEALFKCVKSIRKYYEAIPIYIVDSGHKSQEKSDLLREYNCNYIRVSFDCGVCSAKNEGLYGIPEKYKYIVLLEDDIVFTAKTKLENWRRILHNRNQIGIIGGLLKRVKRYKREEQRYEATLRLDHETIFVEKIDEPKWRKFGNLRYFYCDIIPNVFMMRRDVWKMLKWDENYKTTPEHTDFFLSLKQNTSWKVAFTDSVEMEHHVLSHKDGAYLAKRMRKDGYRHLAEKWGVKFYWNSWNTKWGMPNPLGLYGYSKAGEAEEAEGKERQIVTPKANEIAIGIKTFFREEKLFRTLDSIEKYCPYPYRLYIADDGETSEEKEYRYQKLERQGHEIVRLPFNSGLSSGRNEIVNRVKESYVLLIDDDIMLDDSESLKKMRVALDSEADIGLCAGMLYQENGEYFGNRNYCRGLRFVKEGAVLYRHIGNGDMHKIDGMKYIYAEQVVNCFLAKTEIFKDIKWDNRIKIEWEHMDFFLRLKETKWKAVVCLDAKFIHQRGLDLDFNYNRFRRSAPFQYFYSKHGLQNVINRFQG